MDCPPPRRPGGFLRGGDAPGGQRGGCEGVFQQRTQAPAHGCLIRPHCHCGVPDCKGLGDQHGRRQAVDTPALCLQQGSPGHGTTAPGARGVHQCGDPDGSQLSPPVRLQRPSRGGRVPGGEGRRRAPQGQGRLDCPALGGPGGTHRDREATPGQRCGRLHPGQQPADTPPPGCHARPCGHRGVAPRPLPAV